MSRGSVLLWPAVKDHLEKELAKVDRQLRRDDAPELRGRAQCLEELLNLPEILSLQDAQEG